MTYYLNYVLIMEIRIDTILYTKLGNENSYADHIICSRGPHLSRRHWDLHPWSIPCCSA